MTGLYLAESGGDIECTDAFAESTVLLDVENQVISIPLKPCRESVRAAVGHEILPCHGKNAVDVCYGP